jgi:hypothetical protein
MIRKNLGNEECRLLWCYDVWLLLEPTFLRSLRRLLVTANVVPNSPILVTLMMEALRSSETSVLTRATWRTVPQDGILHGHCRENLKSYNLGNTMNPVPFFRIANIHRVLLGHDTAESVNVKRSFAVSRRLHPQCRILSKAENQPQVHSKQSLFTPRPWNEDCLFVVNVGQLSAGIRGVTSKNKLLLITLRFILRRSDRVVWTGLVWLRIGWSGGLL